MWKDQLYPWHSFSCHNSSTVCTIKAIPTDTKKSNFALKSADFDGGFATICVRNMLKSCFCPQGKSADSYWLDKGSKSYAISKNVGYLAVTVDIYGVEGLRNLTLT